MAGVREMQDQVAGAGTDKVWDQWPGEPGQWYGRFKVYLALGPARSVRAAQRGLNTVRGKQPPGSLGRLDAEIAQKWYWRERANAWDVHQRELLALSERNLRLGLRGRRIELIEDHLELVCDVLDTANLPGVDEKQARAWLPQMRVFLLDLLVAERQEFEHSDYERDDPANNLTITADDLRAAQRAYEAQASLAPNERPEAARLPRRPVRPAVILTLPAAPSWSVPGRTVTGSWTRPRCALYAPPPGSSSCVCSTLPKGSLPPCCGGSAFWAGRSSCCTWRCQPRRQASNASTAWRTAAGCARGWRGCASCCSPPGRATAPATG